ncbi:MAG: glucohydrolase [Spirochaetae bacterium HGW-Spirochaetae-5]|nr:MAG: glucohydrolase [Spirochaetae bacterium HGW-Spirochaetae-5]
MNPHWKNTVVYQIYPKSFQDSNGDGIGDIPGIISRLEFLKELGVNCIWLSPVYRSPNDDNGYDISDYRDINPEYGTMTDMDNLISSAKKLGIGIIMDLVINHTSDEHEWFVKSRDKSSPYRDYYFWREGKKGKLPNNWTSFFAEDAWSKDEASGEYYLHLFSKKQPDLNYHNPRVLDEIKDIMRFWLDKGISGFRCDVINIIWKSSLENGRKRLILTGKEHYLTQEGMHRILKTLRKDVLDNYDCFTVGETVFVTPKDANDLCSEESKELDMIFCFEHMECDQIIVKWFTRKFKPKRLFKVLTKWQNGITWNALYFENHDQPRSISRFIKDRKFMSQGAKALAMMLFTLRGTPFVFQGQEIGMTNFDIESLDQIQDIESHNVYKLARRLHFPEWYAWRMIQLKSRDNARTPMQWNNTENAGFSTGNPWIKVNENFHQINVESQISSAESVLAFYRKLIDLRKTSPLLIDGNFRKIKITKSIFVYERFIDEKSENINLSQYKQMRVIINLSNKTKKYKSGDKVLLSTYERDSYDGNLFPYEGIILYESVND